MENEKYFKTAYFHLPGLFEFYELYKEFLPVFRENREYFYEWCDIGSVYGAPADCLWGGGRAGYGDNTPEEVLSLMREYGISARLTFSNSLIGAEHLADRKCNRLCELFAGDCLTIRRSDVIRQQEDEGRSGFVSGHLEDEGKSDLGRDGQLVSKRLPGSVRNGVIIYSDVLMEHIRKLYPELYFVSTTTKVQTDFDELRREVEREEFSYVVPDFRLNKSMDKLSLLTDDQKRKIEFLCNECCYFGCTDRRKCYEEVSRKNLGWEEQFSGCSAPDGNREYKFSKAMKNPGFIGVDDIVNTYLPMGFNNFKIEGRSLGSAIVLEFLLYYMTKPEHQLEVREKIYLDSMLDLF